MRENDEIIVKIENDYDLGGCAKCPLRRSLLQAAKLSESLDNAYSILGVGLIFFDGDKKVIHVNARTIDVLNVPKDFIEQGGDLIKNSFSGRDQANLIEAIDQMYASSIYNEAFVSVTINGATTVVMLERLEQTAFNLDFNGAVMFIFNSKRNIEVSSGGIAQIFGLTKAEARLTVAIVNGMTAAEYSAANGVSIHTAYSQIKAILAKTGVRRQSELVRLVLEYTPSFETLTGTQLKRIYIPKFH